MLIQYGVNRHQKEVNKMDEQYCTTSNTCEPNNEVQYDAACMEVYGAEGIFGSQYEQRPVGTMEHEHLS